MLSPPNKRVWLSILLLLCTVFALFSWLRASPADLPPVSPDPPSITRVPLPHSLLNAPFLVPGLVNLNQWSSRGQTLVRNNDFVRLVADRPAMVGLVFTNDPLPAKSFEILLSFHIYSNPKRALVGDGMALWLLDSPPATGEVFGIQNKFNGLGIMLDTFRNGNRGAFPYINVMLGDGNTPYNKFLDGSDTRLDGCVASGTVNPIGEKSQLRVQYLTSSHLLIDLDVNGDGHWKNCVTRMGVLLPETVYLGLSAETGQLSHFVDVLQCSVVDLRLPTGEPYVLHEQWDDSGRPAAAGTRKRRMLSQRIRARERKAKQDAQDRRQQKYGDPDLTFVRRVHRTVVRLLLYAGIGAALVALLYIAWLFWRTLKQSRKSVGGLLD